MNKGIVFVGNRNQGKTTLLLGLFCEYYLAGKRILVIDSATDHPQKSLISKISRLHCCDSIDIPTCPEEQIHFPILDSKSYPFELIKSNTKNIFLCDVGYYLEKGYDYPEGVQREQIRTLYKKLSMQVINVLKDNIDIIIMDEIELPQEVRPLLEAVLSRGIKIYMSLHSTESVSNVNDLFTIKELSLA